VRLDVAEYSWPDLNAITDRNGIRMQQRFVRAGQHMQPA